jgi:riboflavin synthase
MFTGLIEEIGLISVLRPVGGGYEIAVTCPQIVNDGLHPGDSIAVSGPCLTVEKLDAERFWARAMAQTAQTTTLAGARVGQRVNLERALRVGDRLGGHFVLGHVDGIADVTQVRKAGDAKLLTVEFPPELAPYLVSKGSVCLDGVSLTIAEIVAGQLTVSLVKETQERTTLGEVQAGQRLNIEVDIIAKHVAALLVAREQAAEPDRSAKLLEFLAEE